MSAGAEFVKYYNRLKEIVEEVQRILNIFKKNPNRDFSKEYLNHKRNLVKECRERYNGVLKKVLLRFRVNKELNEVISKNREKLRELIRAVTEEILKRERDNSDDTSSSGESQSDDEETMSAFNYDSAARLPELKTLNTEEVRDFLNSIEGYHSILTQEAKATLVEFACRTKIKGPAKTRVGDRVVRTLEELKVLVQGQCSATESVEALSKKLESCRQARRTPEEFALEITALTDKLANLEIANQANASEAVKTAVKGIYRGMGLSAFNRGIDPSIQPTVIASRSATLEEALKVAVTASASCDVAITTPVKEELFQYGHSSQGCFVCGKPGHWARDCHQRWQNRSSNGHGSQAQSGEFKPYGGRGQRSRGSARGQSRGGRSARGGQRGRGGPGVFVCQDEDESTPKGENEEEKDTELGF